MIDFLIELARSLGAITPTSFLSPHHDSAEFDWLSRDVPLCPGIYQSKISPINNDDLMSGRVRDWQYFF